VSLGEIDCRCQIKKQVEKSGEKDARNAISNIQARLFDHLKEQAQLLPTGVQIFVYNHIPPSRQANINPALTKVSPSLGTDEERRSYAQLWNKQLEANCAEAGFTFFNIYKYYVGEDGFLAEWCTHDGLHVCDPCHVAEVIRSHGLGDTLEGEPVTQDPWLQI